MLEGPVVGSAFQRDVASATPKKTEKDNFNAPAPIPEGQAPAVAFSVKQVEFVPSAFRVANMKDRLTSSAKAALFVSRGRRRRNWSAPAGGLRTR